MKNIIGFGLIGVWIYIYYLMHKAQLKAWEYFWGACGLFIIMMVWVRPIMTQPLAEVVAAVAGVFGDITGMYTAFFKYGVLFVNAADGAITLQIDFEEGDSVVVTGGVWKDTVGVVQSINEAKQIVTINVELFGRETPVEISFAEVKKM